MTDNKRTLLTREWLAELQEELRSLKEEKRIEIAEKLKEAISYGDLSENAEYQAARDEQAYVELRIDELEVMLKPGNYDLIDESVSKKKRSGINVGSCVTLRDEENTETPTYTIVWSQEANILDNKISNESPIGHALLWKNQGDEIEIETPAGISRYIIIAVH